MDLLDSIFKNAFGKNTENLKVHIVYAGLSYFLLRFNDPLDLLFRFLLHALQRYGLESIFITMLTMERVDLVTKEATKEFYKGNRVENRKIEEKMYKMYEISMNDDLEEFFESSKLERMLGTNFDDDGIIVDEKSTFFLPKITDDELRFFCSFNLSFQTI